MGREHLLGEIYWVARQILKDTCSTLKYSLHNPKAASTEITWDINENSTQNTIQFKLPLEGSANPGALLVLMGAHTIEETWDEYKDFWYEDIERQIGHLEKGTGP